MCFRVGRGGWGWWGFEFPQGGGKWMTWSGDPLVLAKTTLAKKVQFVHLFESFIHLEEIFPKSFAPGAPVLI